MSYDDSEFKYAINEYLEKRLENELKWHQKRAQRYRYLFLLERSLTVASAAAIPILIVNEAGYSNTVVAAASMIILLLLALDWSVDLHGQWTFYQSTAISIEGERFLYLSRAGPYSNLSRERSFSLLVERAESIISRLPARWEATEQAQSYKRGELTPALPLAGSKPDVARLANYDGWISARLETTVNSKGSIVARVACQFRPEIPKITKEPDPQWTANARVLIQGEIDIDPVEFTVKAIPVSEARLTAFPRSTRVLVPLKAPSDGFEFALVEESLQSAEERGSEAKISSILIDVSQAGRTIQLVELLSTSH